MLAWFQSNQIQPRPFPRAEERFAEDLRTSRVRLDKQLFWVLLVQWAVLLLGTLALSAGTDFASVRSSWATLLVNGLLAGVPLCFVLHSPGKRSTRMTVAVAQGLFSTLLLIATGGRMETHFHLFAWLPILAVYRDVRVLIVAGGTAVFSRVIVGMSAGSPELSVENLSQLTERAAWLIGETVCLAMFIRFNLRTMSDLARREAALEALNRNVERKVERRTREMSEKLEILQRESAKNRELRNQSEVDETTTAAQLSQLRCIVSKNAEILMDSTWQWPESKLPEALRPHWRAIREASQELLNLAEAANASIDSPSALLASLPGSPPRSLFGATDMHSFVDIADHRALLLIDDPVQQALTVNSLSLDGFAVEVTHSGPSTYYSAMLRDYDLILVDVDLANEEGFDTIEALRRLPNGIGDSTSVFAISSARTPDKVLRGAELGIDGFLLKPVSSASLHAVLSGRGDTDCAQKTRIRRKAVSVGKLN